MGCRCAGVSSGPRTGNCWRALEKGPVKYICRRAPTRLCTFDHPLDVRLHCDALAKAAARGSRLEFINWTSWIRLDIAGYGMVHLPLSTGAHALEIHCWRPAGSWYQNLSAKFIGGYPRLVRPQLVVSVPSASAWPRRRRGPFIVR